PDTHPHLAEAAAYALATGYDPADEFHHGLTLILTALRPGA
ncbi:TetR/AcrR family transcriptional regulator, partial [Streptomyces durbertensis]|nr:TetR/AcrR family transcriptional regulator [Streptomyces durbertensis]